MNIKGTKRILCYGDSNTWGWVPSSMGKQRFDINSRWPGILQKKLGEEYEIIEEGLGGRTTMFDDPRPEFPLRNGLKTLPIILESHLPLDYVIIMLGTTDTKEMMNLSAEQTVEGMRELILCIKKFRVLDGSKSPEILIVVPPVVDETCAFASKLFIGGTAKATALREKYKVLAEEEKVLFLDSTNKVKVDSEEGVHIDALNHEKLAEAIVDKILNSENNTTQQ
ncbi:MAG: GDSL-type esterase/lipase family protein [Candidatus Nanoarchaeia archaeon]